MKLVLIRGIPGSGKTTLAGKIYPHLPLVEADKFFIKPDGIYEFKRGLTGDAHQWCQSETKRLLFQGKDVVVTNTFTVRNELDPYIKLAVRYGVSEIIIHTTKGNFESIHGVPEEDIERMKDRWETINFQAASEYYGIPINEVIL